MSTAAFASVYFQKYREGQSKLQPTFCSIIWYSQFYVISQNLIFPVWDAIFLASWNRFRCQKDRHSYDTSPAKKSFFWSPKIAWFLVSEIFKTVIDLKLNVIETFSIKSKGSKSMDNLLVPTCPVFVRKLSNFWFLFKYPYLCHVPYRYSTVHSNKAKYNIQFTRISVKSSTQMNVRCEMY